MGYWIITSVAYILGLVATFISLFVMNSAQPALLYLVPFTLIPTILVAWIRGDLPSMWEGDFKVEKDIEEEEGQPDSVSNGHINTESNKDSQVSTEERNKLLE